MPYTRVLLKRKEREVMHLYSFIIEEQKEKIGRGPERLGRTTKPLEGFESDHVHLARGGWSKRALGKGLADLFGIYWPVVFS